MSGNGSRNGQNNSGSRPRNHQEWHRECLGMALGKTGNGPGTCPGNDRQWHGEWLGMAQGVVRNVSRNDWEWPWEWLGMTGNDWK